MPSSCRGSRGFADCRLEGAAERAERRAHGPREARGATLSEALMSGEELGSRAGSMAVATRGAAGRGGESASVERAPAACGDPGAGIGLAGRRDASVGRQAPPLVLPVAATLPPSAELCPTAVAVHHRSPSRAPSLSFAKKKRRPRRRRERQRAIPNTAGAAALKPPRRAPSCGCLLEPLEHGLLASAPSRRCPDAAPASVGRRHRPRAEVHNRRANGQVLGRRRACLRLPRGPARLPNAAPPAAPPLRHSAASAEHTTPPGLPAAESRKGKER